MSPSDSSPTTLVHGFYIATSIFTWPRSFPILLRSSTRADDKHFGFPSGFAAVFAEDVPDVASQVIPSGELVNSSMSARQHSKSTV
jgi:hypothetical protein